MEHLLHYVWKHKLFPLKVLQTTKGLLVEIIDSGLQNPDAGPDFFNAKLKIDGTLWVGNIEIHTHSSDWYRHGHDHDKAYDSVILHVVAEADAEVTRSNGEQIPQLLLTCPENVQTHYHELCIADQYPACYSIIGSLSKLTIRRLFRPNDWSKKQGKLPTGWNDVTVIGKMPSLSLLPVISVSA